MRWLYLCSILMVGQVAQADDRPEINVTSGAWMSGDLIDGVEVDVCLAIGSQGKLAFRADKDTLEVRTSNENWSLAADSTGDMTVTAGSFSHTYSMHTMDSTHLTGVVEASDLTPLLDAMNKAPIATLTFNKKNATTVSLSGSTKALNDWRTCVGSHGFGNLGGGAGKTTSPFD